MAEAQNDGGQSMDDILASIRRIISDEPTQPLDTADQVGADETTVSGGAGPLGSASGPKGADDLSDILESGPSGSGNPGSVTAAEPAKGSDGSKPWPFVGEPTSKQSGGSLKNKLASLDGSGQEPVPLDEAAARSGSGAAPGNVPIAVPGAGGVNDPGNRRQGSAGTDKPAASAKRIGDGGGITGNVNAAPTADLPEPGMLETVLENSAPTSTAAAGTGKASLDAIAAAAVTVEPVDLSGKQRVRAENAAAKPVTPEPERDAIPSDIAAAAGRGMAGPSTSTNNEMNVVGGEPAKIHPANVTSIAMAPSVAAGAAASEMPVRSTDGGKSLESLVSDALQPLLREWLETNLPRLVEERLDAEMRRLQTERKTKGD